MKPFPIRNSHLSMSNDPIFHLTFVKTDDIIVMLS